MHRVRNNWLKRIAERDLWKEISEKGPTPLIWTDDPSGGRIGKWPEGRNWIDEFKRRDEFVQNYAWAVPTREAISKIQQFVGDETILEIGAGRGLWAKLLQDAGVKIIPTDAKTDESAFTQVHRMKHKDALQTFGDNAILMFVWPEYNKVWAAKALRAFKGNKVIYVGEGGGDAPAMIIFIEYYVRNFNLSVRPVSQKEKKHME